MEAVTTRKEEYREGNTSVPFQEIWAEELRKLLQLYRWSNPIHCRLGVTHPLAASTCGNSETGRNVNNAGNLSGTQGYLLHLNVRCQPQMSIFKKRLSPWKEGFFRRGCCLWHRGMALLMLRCSRTMDQRSLAFPAVTGWHTSSWQQPVAIFL